MSAWMIRAPGGEGVEVAGHPVVEPGAQADDQVAALEAGDRGDGAVHAGHAEVLRVAVGEGAPGHQRGDERDAGELGEHLELAGRAGADDPAADVEDRPLRLEDQSRGLADLLGVRAGDRAVAGQVQLGGPGVRRARLEGGLGHVDEHRAGPPGRGDVEGLGHDPRDLVGVGDQEVVLGDRHRDAADVGFLEGVGADGGGAHLTGDGHDRDGVHVGVGQRGHQVGGTRARRGHAHAHPPGRGGEPLGGVAGALLVADQDVADRGVHQRVVRREDGAARDAEDVGGAGGLQRLDQALRTGDGGARTRDLLAHVRRLLSVVVTS